MKKQILRLFWIPAALLLAAVLLIVNLPRKTALPAGAEEGQQLPDFSITCMDGSEFELSRQRGKVVVINIWATWCNPCVKELPHFDRLQKEHPTDVAVLALHALPVTADVADYLSAFSYEIPFAVDGDGSLSETLHVSEVLPQTLVISPDGIVTYNRPGALDYEKLSELVAEAK